MRHRGLLAMLAGLLAFALFVTPAKSQNENPNQNPNRDRNQDSPRVEVEVDVQDARPVVRRDRETGRIEQLTDFHLASWILLDNEVQLRISEMAREKAHNASVRQFAERMIDSHNKLMGKLHEPLDRFSARKKGVEFDFTAVLKEVTSRLEQADSRRRRTGYRGIEGEAEQPDASRRRLLDTFRQRREERQLDEERREAEESREDLRDARRDREIFDDRRERAEREERAERDGQRNGLFNRDREDRRVREERRELRDEREDVRAERRDDARFDGEFRTAVRENLPEILDLIEEVVETADDDQSSLAFIQFKRQLAEKYTDSVVEEMKRQPDADFDQAYLGFEVANHIRLIDTMEVAQRHASPELARTLEQSIATMHEHLNQARQLMKEIGTHRDVPSRSKSSRTDAEAQEKEKE